MLFYCLTNQKAFSFAEEDEGKKGETIPEIPKKRGKNSF